MVLKKMMLKSAKTTPIQYLMETMRDIGLKKRLTNLWSLAMTEV
jgi:hypothetical protein